MFKEYLTDSLGNKSSTRLQSIHTHFFTLILITVLVVFYMVLTVIHSIRHNAVVLIEVPDNVTNIIVFIVTILLTYASAPKALAQRSELNTFKSLKHEKDNTEPIQENS